MKSFRPPILFLLGGLSLFLASNACAPAHSRSEKVLRVGVLGPFTGPSARTGQEFRGSVEMAFQAIDYKIGDYKVELAWIDSQSDPQKAAIAYEEAILRDHIDAGCLNWHSSVAVAVMEVNARYKLPHFFGMAGTGVVNEKYNSDRSRYGFWMAKGWPTPSKLTRSYVNALEEAIQGGLWKPGRKTAAIWGEDTDWGRAFGGAIRDQLRARGWRIDAEEYFELTETDYYPLLRKFKDREVALLAGTGTVPASMSAFIKQAKEVGIKSLIIADGLGWVGEWYTLTGDASDYVLDQIPGWMTPTAKQFAMEFEKTWKIKPSPAAAGLSFDYANFFIAIAKRALEEYGRIDKQTLYLVGQQELMTGKLTYTGGVIMKEYKYTPETAPDPVVGEGNYIFPIRQYWKGQNKVIWPAMWKEASLQAPE